MILLDALYINNSGGKILLDYLVMKLQESNSDVYYLFDARVKDDYKAISADRKLFLKASLINRYKFYLSHKNSFHKVLCFGNLPPNIRLAAQVFTYFHQLLFLNIPDDLTLANKIKYLMKINILASLKGNSDYWFVQSHNVKSKLSSRFNIDYDNIIEMPFYPSLSQNGDVHKKDATYLYVSSGSKHKNHLRLIDAFCKFYDLHKVGELHLTVSDVFLALNDTINLKVLEGYPIVNHGFLDRTSLSRIYAKSKYVVYPSLIESFGLGLIEGLENGCKILGADLPYTYAVCEPSLVFDPMDVNSIVRVMEKTLSNEVPASFQKVYNKIDELLLQLK